MAGRVTVTLKSVLELFVLLKGKAKGSLSPFGGGCHATGAEEPESTLQLVEGYDPGQKVRLE